LEIRGFETGDSEFEFRGSRFEEKRKLQDPGSRYEPGAPNYQDPGLKIEPSETSGSVQKNLGQFKTQVQGTNLGHPTTKTPD
jgi:hypothetical protein